MGLAKRGGARAGGGRPSPWRHHPTRTIRIPQLFEAILLEIAQNLDQSSEDDLVINLKTLAITKQTKKEQLNLLKIPIYKHSSAKVVRLEDLANALQALLQQ
ncbi:MAG: hypothetical protein KME27_29410 [Lyngbya sp. HA4199-MV5]|jgi:hypothetical protein|nr:hypothetical protein [Lyngbya sp. HA4199-MV5]